MLSKVQERRDVALVDFYKRPPSGKRKHDDQDGSGGEGSSPMPATKTPKSDKTSSILGVVSWVENSSLPSKSMVLCEIESLSYVDACMLVLTAVKDYFDTGMMVHMPSGSASKSSGKTATLTLPGRSRLDELIADFMKPLTSALTPLKTAVRKLPPASGKISIFQNLHPLYEAQFCAALVKVFLSLDSAGEDASPTSAPDSARMASVAWCLFDVLFTPIASSDVVVQRIGRVVSMAVSMSCRSLLTAAARWMSCYDRHILMKSKPASKKKPDRSVPTCPEEEQQQGQLSVCSRIVALLITDFIDLSMDHLATLSHLPELSLDMTAVFVVEYMRQWPVVRPSTADSYATEPTAGGGVRLPPHDIVAMVTEWLVRWPRLSITVPQSSLPQRVPLCRDWPAKPSSTSSTRSSGSHQQPCPLEGLVSLSVCGPLACHFVSHRDKSVSSKSQLSSSRKAKGSLNYSNNIADLHGQLLLGMSLHKSSVDSAASLPSASRVRHSLSAQPLVSAAEQCRDISRLAKSAGVDITSVMPVAVEHLAQLIQVMASAQLVSFSKDQLESIKDLLPANQLLNTVLAYQSQRLA